MTVETLLDGKVTLWPGDCRAALRRGDEGRIYCAIRLDLPCGEMGRESLERVLLKLVDSRAEIIQLPHAPHKQAAKMSEIGVLPFNAATHFHAFNDPSNSHECFRYLVKWRLIFVNIACRSHPINGLSYCLLGIVQARFDHLRSTIVVSESGRGYDQLATLERVFDGLLFYYEQVYFLLVHKLGSLLNLVLGCFELAPKKYGCNRRSDGRQECLIALQPKFQTSGGAWQFQVLLYSRATIQRDRNKQDEQKDAHTYQDGLSYCAEFEPARSFHEPPPPESPVKVKRTGTYAGRRFDGWECAA